MSLVLDLRKASLTEEAFHEELNFFICAGCDKEQWSTGGVSWEAEDKVTCLFRPARSDSFAKKLEAVKRPNDRRRIYYWITEASQALLGGVSEGAET